jgi:predicted lipoprotein with Yx(FWY)xxD motif
MPFGGSSLKRILALLLAALVLTALSPELAGAGGSRAKLLLRKTHVGTILVNSRGFTLYAFTTDKGNHDSCVKKPGCLTAWPAVKSSGQPIAGPGVRAALIGTIKLGNSRQVTYAGHPLYTYIADRSAGQTNYVNIYQFGGRWPAVNAAGHEVK